MTHHSRPWSAVDAIISAGRNSTAQASTSKEGAASVRLGAPHCRVGENPAAALILSRVLALTMSGAKPCVQFVSCTGTASPSTASLAISQVAANILGRSLLLNAGMDHNSGVDEGGQNEPMPDGFLPDLYHHRLVHDAAGLDILFGRARRGAFTAMIAPFQFIAIDSQSPCHDFAGAALAPMCTGTVLVVRAGESSHGAIKEAALHITRAGGRIIGSILDEVPASLPRWFRRP